jgi:phosphocarrier protein HPr
VRGRDKESLCSCGDVREEGLVAERETTVGPEAGLHARPAAQFVKTAKRFSSEIVVRKGDEEANAKSSLKIMTLGAKKGDRIVIRAEGDDAQEAVDALTELISADEH